MGQHPADKNLVVTIAHHCDDSIIIAAHIENRVGVHVISAAKSFTQMIETGEISFFSDAIPFAHGVLGVSVNYPETPQRF
jgi:hypothetical protein